MTIRNEFFLGFSGDLSVIRADIDVDTADELPEINAIPGRILHQGSVAYAIKAREIYVLASDGKWYSSEAET